RASGAAGRARARRAGAGPGGPAQPGAGRRRGVTRGRRSFWGWGLEEAALGPDRLDGLGALLAGLFGSAPERRRPVPLQALELPPPRIAAPAALAPICDASAYERARHAYGRSYRDVVRGFRGEFPHPPDLVAFPR